MQGKLNLPIFLFNVGLLTLINMDSLMFLAKTMPLPPYYLKYFEQKALSATPDPQALAKVWG